MSLDIRRITGNDLVRGERTVDLERLGEVAKPHGCTDDGVDNVDVGADRLVSGRFGQRLHGELQSRFVGEDGGADPRGGTVSDGEAATEQAGKRVHGAFVVARATLSFEEWRQMPFLQVQTT